jgi:serine phosphatase RsbU (regulator of sigma subunit)/PAS domain-containing protein/anti-sigma regulatory factor (Ser/Thr protein kinase)
VPEQRLRSVLDAARLGTFDIDVAAGLVTLDRRGRTAFGIDGDAGAVAVDELLEVVLVGDRAAAARVLRPDAHTNAKTVECRVGLEGAPRWLEVHTEVVRDGGGPTHVLGTVRDMTELRAARNEVARVLDQVGGAFLALDLNDAVVTMNRSAERLLRRSGAAMLGRSFWSDVPGLLGPTFAVPPSDVVRGPSGVEQLGTPAVEPVVVEDWSELLGRWVELHVHRHPGGTWVYLTDVSERRATADRNRRLQQIAAALARSLTTVDVAAAALEHARSGVRAESAGVLLVDDERRELHLEAGLDELSPAMRQRWSRLPLSASTPLNLAMDTAVPQLVGAGEVVDRWPHLARDVQQVGASFFALFPLVTAGRPLGLLVLGWTTRTSLDDDELAFLGAVSAQCAQALERAALFDQQLRIAESLQRSLLPQRLPEVPSIELGARYLAGAAGLQVGGDWYDVLPLPDGRVAFALGDVVGKGLPAASAMGQVRYALRAYAVLDPAPAAVLACLDDFFATRDDEEIVTLVYGVLDPADGVLTWANAGHPPPLVVSSRGKDASATGTGSTSRTLSAVADGTPLGVRSHRKEATLQLAPGDCLVLYSDGLVESRTRPVGEGLEALLLVATEPGLAEAPADDMVGRLLSRMLGPRDAEDDATLLAVRWLGAADMKSRARPVADSSERPPHTASTKLRPEALASSSARRFLRSLLDRWSLLELSDVAELCVSELVTNAVLHARTPIEVDVRAGRGVLHVEVRDRGGHRIDLPAPKEPGETLESGRGLYIVQALSSATGVRAGGHGTSVWFELNLPSTDDPAVERVSTTGLG